MYIQYIYYNSIKPKPFRNFRLTGEKGDAYFVNIPCENICKDIVKSIFLSQNEPLAIKNILARAWDVE